LLLTGIELRPSVTISTELSGPTTGRQSEVPFLMYRLKLVSAWTGNTDATIQYGVGHVPLSRIAGSIEIHGVIMGCIHPVQGRDQCEDGVQPWSSMFLRLVTCQEVPQFHAFSWFVS
jgi:hypothetical protein